MRRVGTLAVIAFAVAGCGGSDPGPCGILANGTKLCGQDLKGYCQKFEQGTLDRDTTLACALVGVSVLPATTTDPGAP